MNDVLNREQIKASLKPAFKGRKSLPAKTIQLYPFNAEREYKRLAEAYMTVLRKTIDEEMPSLLKAYGRDLDETAHYDDAFRFMEILSRKFDSMAKKLEKRLAKFDLPRKIQRFSSYIRKNDNREWKRTVKTTLEAELLDDYYNDDFYSDITQKWISDNLTYIKSIPSQRLGELKSIISEGFKHGTVTSEIADQIDEVYNTGKSKAFAIARDQVSKLNSQYTKRQHEDAGITKYKWSDSNDIRVRACHKALNGKIFRYDNPPEMWYESKSGRIYTGRHCNPGEDFCCRCCAIPVFEIETLNLPFNTNTEKEVEYGQNW